MLFVFIIVNIPTKGMNHKHKHKVFCMSLTSSILSPPQHWAVFRDVSELFIMVPALLGLKGNLEMTLASRLSTHANLGHLDKRENCLSMIVGNMALIQVS